jgi:hypothetical protein
MAGFSRHTGWLIIAFLTLSLSSLLPGEDEHAYVGSKKCKMCHLKEWKSWSETKMAKSFELLQPGIRAEQKKAAGLDPDKDYSMDAECLPCHTVGYGKEGGFSNLESTPDHAGVGCEMCHGPGGTYIQKQYMSLQNKNYKRDEIIAVGMVDQINAETCTAVCHNNESPFVGEDYVFDFEARKDEGIHERYPLKYEH